MSLTKMIGCCSIGINKVRIKIHSYITSKSYDIPHNHESFAFSKWYFLTYFYTFTISLGENINVNEYIDLTSWPGNQQSINFEKIDMLCLCCFCFCCAVFLHSNKDCSVTFDFSPGMDHNFAAERIVKIISDMFDVWQNMLYYQCYYIVNIDV